MNGEDNVFRQLAASCEACDACGGQGRTKWCLAFALQQTALTCRTFMQIVDVMSAALVENQKLSCIMAN